MSKRVVGAIRLSNLTDESSSPERQRGKIHAWSDLHDGHVVGIAEDLDVSAITASPWEREDLKYWLEHPEEFDVLLAWKLDRLARKTRDFLELLDWAEKHGIQIVTIEDGIDLSTDVGRMVATILAAFAEWEGRTMKARAKDAYDHNVRKGKWRGGNVPYGYWPVKKDDGWYLEIDPVSSKILLDCVERIMNGESANSIVADLNDRGVLTPSDYQRKRQGKELKGYKWRVSNFLLLLRSRILMGEYEAGDTKDRLKDVSERKEVLGEDQLPLKRAEPILSYSKWKALQNKLEENSRKQGKNVFKASPYKGVSDCPLCGHTMYRQQGRTHMYYYCSSKAVTGKACGNGSIPAPRIEQIVETTILGVVGDLERQIKVEVPGQDYTAEVERIEKRLSVLREDRNAGLFRGTKGDKEYREMYASLEAKREELESLPKVPDRVEWQGTGQTMREHWESLSIDEKGTFLRSVNVKVLPLRWGELLDPTTAPKNLRRLEFGHKTYALGENQSQRMRQTHEKVHVIVGDLAELYARSMGLEKADEQIKSVASKVLQSTDNGESVTVMQAA